MNYRELIYEYLDGELDPVIEEKLFAEMSLDQELRDEFSQQVKINNFALQDMTAMQVPSETTAAVFSNLGFTIPPSIATNTPTPFLAFLKSKRFAKASLSLAALILTFISGWWMSSVTNTVQPIDESQNTACIMETSGSANKPTSNSANLLKYTYSSHSIAKHTQMASTDLATTSTNRTNSNSITNNENANNEAISDEIVDTEDIVINDETALKEATQNVTVPQMLSYSSLNGNVADFSFSGNENQVFDLIANNNPDSDFETTLYTRGFRIANELPVADDKSFFSGSSISLMYKLNDEHYIGGDFGEDEFYQEFYYQNGEQNVLYKQAPNYYWGAVSYKYLPHFLRIGNFAQPYTKLSVGGCKAGAIGKAQIGLNFQINKSLNAFIGGEYNTLFFNIRRDFYTSHKFEFLYGISINL